MAPLTTPVDELFAALIGKLEEDPGFDVQAFVSAHPSHAAALKARLERLRRVGLVGDARGESTLVAAMRERFGVYSEVRLDRPPVSPALGHTVEELLPSRVVGGRYRILNELGRGGMGRVFRALDLDLGREVALKVADLERLLPAAHAAQRQAWIERFLTEAQVTAQLEHPSIVPVHDVGIDRAGELYYTMKLVEGETLEEKIAQWRTAFARGTPFPTPELLRIVIQVCQAVAFAHERGVMHRDLKPSNVMVGRFGEVQVMDWGLAKLLAVSSESLGGLETARRGRPGSQTLAGEVLGTPTHMAPEQARGDTTAIGRTADVFGVGAILHHGLLGVPPNHERTEAPCQRADMPVELDAICRRALHPSPAQRYGSALAMAEDLQAFLDQRVVRSYETGALAELRKWVQRNRGMATAMGAAFLALTLGLTLSVIERSKADARTTEVLRLAALQDLEALIAEASELWPLVPDRLGAFRSWITRAQDLVKELPIHRADLERRTGDDTRESRWWTEQLRSLVSGLESLQAGLLAENGVVPGHGWSIPQRRAFVERLEAGFAPGGEFARIWDETLPAIRAAYPGFALSPQFGLVPIGPDPVSGFWEFGHLQTGDVPARDATGKLQTSQASGLVFVLLPGGEFMMGAQASDPLGPNRDVDAKPVEFPPHPVRLDPFFLSKYEMTQGQWIRCTGRNPSDYDPDDYDASWNRNGRKGDLTHPVEQVDWGSCMEVCRRMGLRLPSEAQWEYGARGGTTDPWWTGSDQLELQDAGNLADDWCRTHGGATGWAYETWNDGNTVHSPVGEYKPNPFGLHDVIGNVSEWCEDAYDRDSYKAQTSRNPVVDPDSSSRRVVRGGSFNVAARAARSASRLYTTPDSADDDLGLRPSKPLEP